MIIDHFYYYLSTYVRRIPVLVTCFESTLQEEATVYENFINDLIV